MKDADRSGFQRPNNPLLTPFAETLGIVPGKGKIVALLEATAPFKRAFVKVYARRLDFAGPK